MLCHEQTKLLVVLVTVAADSIQQISGRDLGERQMGCVPHSLENPDAETLNIYPDESSYHICIECPIASFICEKDQGGNVRTISEPLGQSARIHGYQWNIDGDKQVAKLNSSLALWTRQVYCESQGESFHAKNIICNGDLCEDWKTILTETDIEQRVSRRSTATITMTNNHTDVMVQTLLQNSTLYTNGDTQGIYSMWRL